MLTKQCIVVEILYLHQHHTDFAHQVYAVKYLAGHCSIQFLASLKKQGIIKTAYLSLASK